jgi:hypothetical protein
MCNAVQGHSGSTGGRSQHSMAYLSACNCETLAQHTAHGTRYGAHMRWRVHDAQTTCTPPSHSQRPLHVQHQHGMVRRAGAREQLHLYMSGAQHVSMTQHTVQQRRESSCATACQLHDTVAAWQEAHGSCAREQLCSCTSAALHKSARVSMFSGEHGCNCVAPRWRHQHEAAHAQAWW